MSQVFKMSVADQAVGDDPCGVAGGKARLKYDSEKMQFVDVARQGLWKLEARVQWTP